MASVVQKIKNDEATLTKKMLALRPSSTAKDATNELLKEGDDFCGVFNKTCIIDEDDEDICHQEVNKFKCDVPNCDLLFDNLLKYELHYNSCHRFSCSICRKHLPSPHLLDLHLSESHDSFFQVQAKRKPMYRCFVESCHFVSENPSERKKHCIEAHKFPHDFYFGTKKKKAKEVKKSPSRSKKGQLGPAGQSEPAKNPEPVGKVQSTQPAEAAKQKFTFGRKTGGKAFSKRSSKPDTKIELGELMDTLPTA